MKDLHFGQKINFRELKWKLRTDFNFRWNFAQYAMDQPLNWYWNNPRLDGIWKPFNRFDVYFNRINFWYDWAWGYNHHSWYHNYAWNWGWNTWNYHRWNNYSWYYPYYWNESYWFRDHWRMKINEYAWNNRDNSNVVRVRGPRGSRNINLDNNINIENIISRRYDNPPARPNLNDIDIDNPDKRTFLGRLIENWKDNNIKIREFNNVDNLSNDQKEAYLSRIPMSRFGKPDEIANLVYFLSTDKSSYITGQNFHINGGMLMV